MQKLQDHTGTDLLADFPKIAGVWKRIRELPSYKAMDTVKRPVLCAEEWFISKGINYYPAEGVIENY